MSLPLQRRNYDVFLSHAHVDSTFVSLLDRWLTEKAGLKVWYDKRELSGGARLATDLQIAIEDSRAFLLIDSAEAMERGWVSAEYNSAIDERANFEDFRIIVLRIGQASTEKLMKGTTWIDVPEAKLDVETALAIIRAFYPGERRPNPATARDVYISSSWRPEDSHSARAACAELVNQGFRLIGDAKDQEGFGTGNRVERIIASCGAFVGVVPFREPTDATAESGAYKYFIREMDYAAKLGLPSVIIADPRVKRADGQDGNWLAMDTEATKCPQPVRTALENLWEQWQGAPLPQYIFYAMDLESEAASPAGVSRHLIERITGMATVVGTDITSESLHTAIMKKICEAFVVLADISEDNVNACIEAGMGIAVGTNVRLIARGRPRNPPFMLRAAGQLAAYEDEVERIGILHKLMRRHRRRVINAEI